MNLQEYAKLLRNRWVTVVVTMLAVAVGALAYTLLTTPLYQASTRLFVSTSTGGSTGADLYQGNRLSQERVISYAELLKGETLARRTIDKLGLDTTAAALQEAVTAKAKMDTVLIVVDVLDESAVQARDVANAMSDEFVVMVRELETAEDGTKPNARVVVEQRASLPVEPVSPKMTRILLIGVAVGLLLGIAIAVLRDLLDNTVKDRRTLEELAGVGLVGTIPLDKERRKVAAITFRDENSGIAEAFRKLRTNLQFLAVDDPPRVIVITSSMPSEGKSTTAINIALALAEAEHSVVIVDGDMRRPMLDKYLGVIGQVGFSTVLSGRACLSEVLQPTRFSGLTALSSGATPPNPSELLGSLAAKKLISDLRAQFDYVIVDSSPLAAVTDAAILAANSDGVLIMARFGHTKRDQLAQAVKNLVDVGAPLIGAVLTMTPERGQDVYHYGYYRHDGSRSATHPSAPVAEPPTLDPPASTAGLAQVNAGTAEQDRAIVRSGDRRHEASE